MKRALRRTDAEDLIRKGVKVENIYFNNAYDGSCAYRTDEYTTIYGFNDMSMFAYSIPGSVDHSHLGRSNYTELGSDILI